MSSSRSCRVLLARTLALGLLPLAAAGLALPAQAAASLDPLRLCGAEAKVSEYQGLALYPSGDGLELRQVPVDELADELSGYAAAKRGGEACAKATAANLAVQFPGQAAALLAGPVSIGSGGTSVSLLDPALCESYATGSGLSIVLTDTNANARTLSGWSTLRYDLATRRLVPESLPGLRGPLVQCHSFPWTQLLSNPPQYGAAGDDAGIFSASFEYRGDLLVEVVDPATSNRVGEIEVSEGQSFSYELHVSNVGEVAVSNVRIREFLPQLTLTPTVTGGSWTCTRSTGACATASGTGAIALNGLTLVPGERYTFAITRQIPSGTPGQHSMVAAAAFVDPSHASGGGEKNVADNAQPLVLSVVADQAPTVVCSPTSLATLQEDGATVQVSCTASDGDGDPISGMGVTDTGGAGSPVALSNLLHDAGTLTFDVTPKANASGSSQLNVTAQANGITGAPFAIPVTVAAVNDAPTFTTYATTVVLSPTGGVPTDGSGNSLDDGSDHLVSRSADCGNSGSDSCAVSITRFFQAIGAGAPNEAQTVTGASPFICTTQSGTDVPSAFYTRPGAGSVSAGEADIAWVYSKSMQPATEIRCEATFTDSGGASASSTITFLMGPLPPP